MVPYFIGLAFRIFGDFGGDAAAKRKEGDLVVGEAALRRKRERERIVCMHCFFPSPLAPLFSPLRLIPILFFRKKKKRNRRLEKIPFPVSIKSLGSGGKEGKTYQFLPKVASATTKVRVESRRNVKISSTHDGSTQSRLVGVSSEANRNASFKRVCLPAVP